MKLRKKKNMTQKEGARGQTEKKTQRNCRANPNSDRKRVMLLFEDKGKRRWGASGLIKALQTDYTVCGLKVNSIFLS